MTHSPGVIALKASLYPYLDLLTTEKLRVIFLSVNKYIAFHLGVALNKVEKL